MNGECGDDTQAVVLFITISSSSDAAQHQQNQHSGMSCATSGASSFTPSLVRILIGFLYFTKAIPGFIFNSTFALFANVSRFLFLLFIEIIKLFS